jgi:hypothetical protein
LEQVREAFRANRKSKNTNNKQGSSPVAENDHLDDQESMKGIVIPPSLLTGAVLLLVFGGCTHGTKRSAATIIPSHPSDTAVVEFDGDAIPTIVKRNNSSLRLVPIPGEVGGTHGLEVSLNTNQ